MTKDTTIIKGKLPVFYFFIYTTLFLSCTTTSDNNSPNELSEMYEVPSLENFETIMQKDYNYNALKDVDYLSAKKQITAKSPQKIFDSELFSKINNSYIGTAMNYSNLSSEQYLNIFNKEFSSVTLENELKFDHLSTKKGEYNWSEADEMVAYYKKQGKRIHGHVLAWDRADFTPNPQWLYDFEGTEKAYDSLLKNHITTVVKRYHKDIKSWDVANEAFDEHGLGHRPGVWYNNLGISWVEKAFQYANEATNDTEMEFFYNDYHLLSNPIKLDKVLDLLDNIRAKGIKVDGVGLQGHLYAFATFSPIIKRNLKKIVQRGYKVHISELDISLNLLENFNHANWWLLYLQRIKYFTVINAYQKIVPNHLKHGITFWQFSDADSWFKDYLDADDWPCIYDRSYRKKPAYTGYKDGLHGRWSWWVFP